MLSQIPSDSQNTAQSSTPVGTSEDWVVLDSAKSFAWSARQQGSHREQLGALRKLIEQQQQQVDTDNAFITLGNSLNLPLCFNQQPNSTCCNCKFDAVLFHTQASFCCEVGLAVDLT